MNKKTAPFRFKSFSLFHHQSPMKITTDSILLGALAPIPKKCQRILDIGTGCGILALMLSERLQHQVPIDAIDIAESAVIEAQKNCDLNQFAHIRVLQMDLNQLARREKYDLIITNPPYFEVSLNCSDEARSAARQTRSLTFTQLIQKAHQHLNEAGYFCLVLPSAAQRQFESVLNHLEMAPKFACKARFSVRHQAAKPVSLILSCYQKTVILSPYCEIDSLILRDEQGNYTKEAKQKLNGFYLNMK